MASGSYRPQSPDLSTLHSGYRPQSPDLSGLNTSNFNGGGQFRNPAHHLSPEHNSHHFGAPIQSSPTSNFSYQQNQNFNYEYQHPPSYAPPPSGMKYENPPYANDINMSSNNVQPQQVKAEASNPTHGVVLKTSFPVARIKRIMQADEDIGKVAQVTPHVVSRALELFMIKLITASAEQARGPGGATSSKGPRRVLMQHMKRAIDADNTFDFLADIISKVPDAPTKASKKEGNSDSEDVKPRKRSKKRKESTDGI